MTSEIGHHLEMRDYPAFERSVKKILEEYSWEELLERLREIRNASHLAPGWNIALNPGKMRDGIINLLNLQNMEGLDTDLLDSYKHLQGSNLKEIREAAGKHSISMLREQIRVGNTFFIDTEAIKETELTVLIPGIIEARTKEVQALEPNPPLSDVYSTYYGFSILTSGSLDTDWAGIPSDTKSQLIEVMQQLGNVENISARQLKFSYLSFRNCSDDLKVLLWNLLKMCVGGIKSQKAGIDILGNLGDSRAIELMHLKLEKVIDKKVKESLFDSIGRIGTSISFEPVMKQISDGRNLDAVKALSLIRDSRVRNILKQFKDKYYWRDRQHFLEALGNTRDTNWLPYLQHSVRRRSRMKNEAKIAAQKIEAVQRFTDRI